LISSKTTFKYSCNAHHIGTFTHNTCASVYLTMQTDSWHWDELYKNGVVCEHVSERFGFIVEMRCSLVTKWWHVDPSMS